MSNTSDEKDRDDDHHDRDGDRGGGLVPAGVEPELVLRQHLRPDVLAEERFQDTVAKAKAIGMDYPRLRARLETPAATDYAGSPDDSFEFGLQSLLDGLERRLAPG